MENQKSTMVQPRGDVTTIPMIYHGRLLVYHGIFTAVLIVVLTVEIEVNNTKQ